MEDQLVDKLYFLVLSFVDIFDYETRYIDKISKKNYNYTYYYVTTQSFYTASAHRPLSSAGV